MRKRSRVKTLKTRETTVRITSKAGQPDFVQITANKDTRVQMRIRGVKSEDVEKEAEPIFRDPAELFKKYLATLKT